MKMVNISTCPASWGPALGTNYGEQMRGIFKPCMVKKSEAQLDHIISRSGTVLLDFSLTVKAAPHECEIMTSQP